MLGIILPSDQAYYKVGTDRGKADAIRTRLTRTISEKSKEDFWKGKSGNSKNFYNFITIFMPDWKERKKILDEEFMGVV